MHPTNTVNHIIFNAMLEIAKAQPEFYCVSDLIEVITKIKYQLPKLFKRIDVTYAVRAFTLQTKFVSQGFCLIHENSLFKPMCRLNKKARNKPFKLTKRINNIIAEAIKSKIAILTRYQPKVLTVHHGFVVITESRD